MGRRLAYIELFSFVIGHVPGTRDKGPDSLSRRPATYEEEKELRENGRKEEDEIEEAIESVLGRIRMEERGSEVGRVDRNGRKENWELSKVMRCTKAMGIQIERRRGLLDGHCCWKGLWDSGILNLQVYVPNGD